MLSAAGYVCASINYALATREDRWCAYPQNLLDATSAVAWMRQGGSEYGVDPERVGAIGGSAGGTLSLWLALTAEREELRPPGVDADISVAVQVAVNLYGPTDFSLPMPFTTPPEQVAEVSPIHQVKAGAPPILTIQGTSDELVSPHRLRWGRLAKSFIAANWMGCAATSLRRISGFARLFPDPEMVATRSRPPRSPGVPPAAGVRLPPSVRPSQPSPCCNPWS